MNKYDNNTVMSYSSLHIEFAYYLTKEVMMWKWICCSHISCYVCQRRAKAQGKGLDWPQCLKLIKTRYRMTVSTLHGVGKNRTDQRMHLEGSKIAQINPYRYSFLKMSTWFRRKKTYRPGKLFNWRRNTWKWPFFVAKVWITRLWKELNATPLTPDHLLGHPLNLGV